MARKRPSDRHPANLRAVPGAGGGKRDRDHLRSVPDRPQLLPPVVSGDDDDPEVDPLGGRARRLPLDRTRKGPRDGRAERDWSAREGLGVDPAEDAAQGAERGRRGSW